MDDLVEILVAEYLFYLGRLRFPCISSISEAA